MNFCDNWSSLYDNLDLWELSVLSYVVLVNQVQLGLMLGATNLLLKGDLS